MAAITSRATFTTITAATPKTLYTAPGKATANLLNLCNVTAGTVIADISAAGAIMATGISIPQNGRFSFDGVLNLESGDTVQITCDTENGLHAIGAFLEYS